jgi:hypothetical protein
MAANERARARTGGRGEIRTHEGAKPPAGFQDRCLKPLGHPSGAVKSSTYVFSRKNVDRTNRELQPICYHSLPGKPQICSRTVPQFCQRLVDCLGGFVVLLAEQVGVNP